MQAQDPIWITDLFDWCVDILIYWGHIFGVSYEAINIYVFCIIWPIATILLLAIVILQYRKIRSLSR